MQTLKRSLLVALLAGLSTGSALAAAGEPSPQPAVQAQPVQASGSANLATAEHGHPARTALRAHRHPRHHRHYHRHARQHQPKAATPATNTVK